MGEVYRARDTKLNRDVAIKVLPDSFANDADRLARFTREAQVLASLNHPNIGHIYGLEESPSTSSGRAGVRPVVATSFEEHNGQFSPDGKWVAFESNKSGRSEIYVQPFPGLGGDAQVSTAGGAQVRWGPNGNELFYVALDEQLMAVPIQVAGNGQTVEAGTPVALFPSV